MKRSTTLALALAPILGVGIAAGFWLFLFLGGRRSIRTMLWEDTLPFLERLWETNIGTFIVIWGILSLIAFCALKAALEEREMKKAGGPVSTCQDKGTPP